MIYFISRDDFFYPIGRIRAMQVRLFSYFLEEGDTQEYPDDDANQNQKPIHEACARFRFFMQVLGYIVLEEQIDGGYGGACQQQVFGYLVHIYFGKGYERPMAEEKDDEQIDFARECQQQSDGKGGYRAGHHRCRHHRELHAARPRKERVEEGHRIKYSHQYTVFGIALERGVTGK